jgi:hypothetical protein
MGQSNGSSIFKFRTINFIWQRDYRLLVQAMRNTLALLPVLIFFIFLKNEMLIWMGLCVLALMQSNVTSSFFRFEYNIFFAFCVSSIGLLLAVFFTSSIFLLCLFSFFIAFLLFIAVYFKLNAIYSIWVYIVVQFGALSEKSFSDAFQNILYDFYAFLICIFVCAILIRPRLKNECYYEMLAILQYLQRYLNSFKKDLFLNTEKSKAELMQQRTYAFMRLQSLEMIMKELQKKGNDVEIRSVLLIAILKERLAEIIVGTIINIRLVDADIADKNEILSILSYLIQQDMNFTLKRKFYSFDRISKFYNQIIFDTNQKISFSEKKSQKEMALVYAKFRINVNLLPEEIYRYVSR